MPDDKYWIYPIVALLIFLSIWIIKLITEFDVPSSDIEVFYTYANNMKAGMIPYRDFVIEFPPLAAIVFLLPGLCSDTIVQYDIAFSIFVTIICIILSELTIYYLDEPKSKKAIVVATYILLFLIYMDYLEKFDIFCVFFTALGIVAYHRDKKVLAYAMVTVAVLIKFYPIIICALFFMMDFLSILKERNPSNLIKGMITTMCIAIVSLVPYLALGASPNDLMSWVTFQTDRGYHLESTLAVIVQCISDLGFGKYYLIERYNTYDVISPITNAIIDDSMMITVIMLATVYLFIAYHIITQKVEPDSDQKLHNLCLYSLALIFMFVMINNVFSTQYILWLLPMILWVSYGKRRCDLAWTCIWIIAVFGLSTIRPPEYPIIFHTCFAIRDIIIICVQLYMFSELARFNRIPDDCKMKVIHKIMRKRA